MAAADARMVPAHRPAGGVGWPRSSLATHVSRVGVVGIVHRCAGGAGRSMRHQTFWRASRRRGLPTVEILCRNRFSPFAPTAGAAVGQVASWTDVLAIEGDDRLRHPAPL